MALTLLIGGARSGKSRLAVRLAASWGGPVAVIATAEAKDEEMADRIRRHRADRPPHWETVEEPIDIEGALASVPDGSGVLLDCLTLWVSNLLERGASDADIEERAREAARTAARRPSGTVAVTNEVGWGVVPDNVLARRFSELLGRVNGIWAEEADRSALVVAGRILPLDGLEVIADERVSG